MNQNVTQVVNTQRMRVGSFASDRLDLLARAEMEERGCVDRSTLISPLLLPHPDDDLQSEESSKDGLSPHTAYRREDLKRPFRMAVLFLLLLAGYGVQRGVCHFNLPQDCVESSVYELFSDLTSIGLYGLVLGWFVGFGDRVRFNWLWNVRRWYSGALFLLVPIAYSAVSNVDALKHDLVDFSSWTAPFIVLWSAALVGILSSIVWHTWLAVRSFGFAGGCVYAATRLFLILWFVVWSLVLENESNPPVRIHLHHLYIGWALALWANVNSPLSAILLAAGSGIFVQGIGAYSFAPIFTSDGCFETPAASAIKCKFWNEMPFTIQICPAAGPIPQHSCK